MKKHTDYLGIVLPHDLLTQLTVLAEKHRVTKSVIARIAIEMYLESMKDVKPVVGDTNGR